MAELEGRLAEFPTERFQTGDRLDVLVNVANGNVVVLARDLTVRGTG